jgi:KDO2-lipid IV(A) lauroyltransferase
MIGGRLHYYLATDKRRNYLDNTARALESGGPHRPWGAFQSHALNVLELLKAVSQPDHAIAARLRLHGRDHIERALGRGKGMILATFHSGNWELAGLMLALCGYPITTIAGQQLRAGWSEDVKALKRRFGIRVLSTDASVRHLYRDLERNRVVVLHVDGDLFRGGIEVPFLGKSIRVPRGPAHLSRVMDSPLAFAYCDRRPDGVLDVHIEHPYETIDNRLGEEAVTKRVVERMENCILQDPGQWCIFRKL